MKAGIDDLFQLIRALSPSEKRYVSIRNAGDAEALYVALYQAIDAQGVYDEDAVSAAIRERDANANLAMLKKYLESYLIGVLCDYHGASKDSWHTHKVLFVSSILHAKGLSRMAVRMLEGVKDQGMKAGVYPVAMLATRMLLSHSEDYYSTELAQMQQQLYDEAHHIMENLDREFDFVYLQVTTQRLMREIRSTNAAEAQLELRELLRHPCLQPGAATTPRQAMTASSTRSRIHMLLGELQQAYEASVQNVHDWELMPEYSTVHIISYAGALNNAFVRALYARQYEALLAMRAKINALPHTTHEMKLFKYQSLTQIDLVITYLTGEYNNLDPLVRAFVKASADYQQYTPPHMLRSIHATVASLYFIQGNWQGASKYVAYVLTDDVAPDATVEQTRVMHIISHYMLHNESIIESLYRSVRRNSKEQLRTTPLEMDVLTLVRKLMRLEGQADKRMAELTVFEQKHWNVISPEATESRIFGTSLRLWIQHERTGTSMLALAQEAAPMR